MRRVESVLAALESARRRLTAEVEGVHGERFTTPPRPGAWSVGHVIEHLARTEEQAARGIQAVCSGKLKLDRRPTDVFRRLIYVSGLYRVVRVRTTSRFEPEAAADHATALARLAATREQLKAAIEDGERRGMWSHALRHPVFGPLSIAELLDFVAYHEERHRRQIVRIKAALDRKGVAAQAI